MRKLITIFSLLFIIIGAFITGADAQIAQLKVNLIPVSSAVQGDSDIFIRVTISNPTTKPITVPIWQVPSDDVPTPIFKVIAADGSEVAYTGPLVKWSPEALKAGITFAPRSTRVFIVELTSLYDIGNGRYRIEYSQHGPGKFDPEGPSSRVFGPISPAYIETRGRTKNIQGNSAPTIGTAAASLSTNRCSGSQVSTIKAAVTNATSYALGAKTYFLTKENFSAASERYLTWFGLATSDRWSRVQTNFDKIHSAFASQNITIDCTCKKKTIYAYVYSNQPYKIYVCGAFWTAPTLGTDSKAGTLIHEMSHFTVVAGTSDYVYGQSGAKDLAIKNPENATKNADNHEYFAENTPVLN